MYQLQAVLHLTCFEEVECFEQFTRSQAELAGVAAALLPLAASAGSQLDADTDVGAYLQLFGHLGDEIQFVQLFYHQIDAFAHLLCQQGQFDEAFVLVTVAHYQRVRVGVDSDHGVQFGFGAGLQSKVELFSVVDHFLDYGSHLVDLDGIDDKVLALVAVFLGCLLEAAGHLLDAVVQNIGKTYQHGSSHVAQLQFVYQFLQIDGYTVLARRYHHMSLFVDTKVRSAPTGDVVQLFRIFNTPFSHRLVFYLQIKINEYTRPHLLLRMEGNAGLQQSIRKCKNKHKYDTPCIFCPEIHIYKGL